MAWTAPMTAVANAVFTAAQFNTHVRDNFLETAPAKATTQGTVFVANSANSIVERFPSTASVNANEALASLGSFQDLTTPGPAVTVDTGTKALVWFAASGGDTTTATSVNEVSVAVSGATTIAASINWELRIQPGTANVFNRVSGLHVFTTLNAGSNVFTLKYQGANGTAGQHFFNQREILVLPL